MTFAMPLVLVTSCSQGAPATVPVDPPPGFDIASAPPPLSDDQPLGDPPEVPPPDRPPPVDAGTMIDAPPPAGPGKVVLWLSGRLVQPEGYVSCHSFGKNRGCNPPRPVRMPPTRTIERMLNVQQGPNNSSVVTVTWHDLGAPIRDVRVRAPRSATAKIVTVRRHQAIIETSLDPATVQQGLELELDLDN